MSERVEAIRRMRTEEQQRPLSAGRLWSGEDMDVLLTALAQAERELDEADTELMVTSTLAEAAMRDRDAARAEVERLRMTCDAHITVIGDKEAALARVRAALRHAIYRNHECTDACSACIEAEAALEGRG